AHPSNIQIVSARIKTLHISLGPCKFFGEAELDGWPTFAKAYVGRKRRAHPTNVFFNLPGFLGGVKGLYSVRKACAGSMDAARRAGMNPARVAARTSVTIETESATASTPLTS